MRAIFLAPWSALTIGGPLQSVARRGGINHSSRWLNYQCPRYLHSLAWPIQLDAWWMRIKCELRRCEWKCEPVRDWSDIFRPTRSLPAVPGATTLVHSWKILSRNNRLQQKSMASSSSI